MSKIIKQDTQGTRPLLQTGELGYDNYVAGGDTGRVYVGTGSANVALAKKAEVTTVDGKIDTHVARVDNPHGVTKIQVGLGNVDNTSDANKPISTAAQAALDLKANLASPALTGMPTAPTAVVGTNSTVLATTAFVNAEITNDTYSKAQLDAGQLDNRYYTEAEVDSKLAVQDGANDISVTPTGNLTSSNVQSALVELQGDIDNRYTKTETNTLLSNKVDDTEKGSANGVATLDANGKVTLTQIPDSVLGQLEYQGVWDFTTLPTATQKGQYWVASVSGNGYVVGDWAVWNGSSFDKVDNTDAVATVAGRTGNVVLTKSDVGLSNVDNTADANKTVLSATKLTTPRNINGVSFDGTSDITVSDNTKLPIGGKAADSDLLDGMQPTTSSVANSIGQRGWDAGFASSYFYANGANARFEAASPVNDWKFFRLTSSGTPKWDIATNETNENGALAFRTGDGANRFLMYHTGELATTNTMYLQQGLSLRERGTLKEILYHSGELLNIGNGFSDVRINNQKAWHAGNDGAGSGMDADKLDNRHATDFMYSQNAGTVSDLNNLLQSGCYRINNTETNRPAGVEYGNILVMHGGGTDTVAQIVSDYGSNNLYWRSGNNSGASWAPWRRIWHDGNVAFDPGNTPYTAVYRNASGNFATNDIIVNGVVYNNIFKSASGTNKEILWTDDTYLSIGYGTNYNRMYKTLFMDNGTTDSPEIILQGNGSGEWEMDTAGGRFRLFKGWSPRFMIDDSGLAYFSGNYWTDGGLTTTNASNVYISSTGAILRSTSSKKYKTDIQDIDKAYIDSFFNNARPIFYRPTEPNDNHAWGYWGFIAEEVAEYDKRLVHWRYDGETVEVTKTKLDHPYEPERIEIEKEEIVLEDGTKEIVEREVIIPEKEATYKEYTTKEFQEDRTKPMIAEGVQYERITVLLTAKVQEQDKEIKSLREELDELKLIVRGLIG